MLKKIYFTILFVLSFIIANNLYAFDINKYAENIKVKSNESCLLNYENTIEKLNLKKNYKYYDELQNEFCNCYSNSISIFTREKYGLNQTDFKIFLNASNKVMRDKGITNKEKEIFYSYHREIQKLTDNCFSKIAEYFDKK